MNSKSGETVSYGNMNVIKIKKILLVHIKIYRSNYCDFNFISTTLHTSCICKHIQKSPKKLYMIGMINHT